MEQKEKVRDKIRKDLAELSTQRSTVDYMTQLDTNINDKSSPYYLDKPVYEKPFDPTYAKPYGRVIASNLAQVKAKYDFNGEPFIKGKFVYKLVLLPEKRFNFLPSFYKSLLAILNGYHVCTGADAIELKAWANQIWQSYAPLIHVFKQTEERMKSFDSIDGIIKKVINKPSSFEGRNKLTKIIWNPDYELTGDQKRQIEREYRGRKSTNAQMKILFPLFVDGISTTRIVEQTGISESTVHRYKRKWKSMMSLDRNIKLRKAA